MKEYWRAWWECIECGEEYRVRNGNWCDAVKRCGKCYLQWKKEERKKNDRRNRNE